MRTTRRTSTTARYSRSVVLAAFAVVAAASTAAAHDFWLIPDLFAFDANSTLQVNARQGGGKFPVGTAVQLERVVDARIIGATTSAKLTEMSVVGSSLTLRHKPTTDGQYAIAVSLAPRVFRETPAGISRFLTAEGGAAEAARLERETPFAGLDSVIFTAASYAATVVEVGTGGPRAFAKLAGIRLEFVPLDDPSHLHVGDTLHVRMLGNGRPVPGIGIELATGLDSTTDATAAVVRIPFTADANGVVHIPLIKAGPVMLRSAYASRKAGGEARDWDVSRTTFVFHVGAQH